MKHFVTKEELAALASMKRYWDEVSMRENIPPGYHQNEVSNVIRGIGYPKVLSIIRDYVRRATEDMEAQHA